MSAEDEAVSLSEEAESEGEGPQIRPPQAVVASAALTGGKSSKHKHKSNKKDRDWARDGRREADRRDRKGDRDRERVKERERRRSERDIERRARRGDDLRNKLSRDKVYDRQPVDHVPRGHHRGGMSAVSSAELRHKYDREMSLLTAEEREKRHEQEERKQRILAANRHIEDRRKEAEDRRKEAVARKKTREIEKEMYRLEEALKRKAAEGRSRSSSRENKKKKKKRRKKSETPEEADESEGSPEEKDREEEEVAAKSGSGSEEGEGEEVSEEEDSGEDGSSSEESEEEEAGSDATTGSQKSEETPDREEESSEEGELEEEKGGEEEEEEKEGAKAKLSKKKQRSRSPIEGKWADHSQSEDSDADRTPSRSPTPLRGAHHSGNDSDRTPRSKQLRGGGGGEDSPLSRPVSPHHRHPHHHMDSPPVSPVPLKDELPPYLPSVHGCRSVAEFKCLNRIEEGTYGVVYRARDKRTLEIVALKRLKMEREKEGFPITSLREINTLLISQHPNVVTVREIVVGSNMDQIYIVMDFVHHDLKSLMETMRKKNQVFLVGEVKCLMVQLMRAIHHLHDNWILHRDLKASNLLLSHNGILKVGTKKVTTH